MSEDFSYKHFGVNEARPGYVTGAILREMLEEAIAEYERIGWERLPPERKEEFVNWIIALHELESTKPQAK